MGSCFLYFFSPTKTMKILSVFIIILLIAAFGNVICKNLQFCEKKCENIYENKSYFEPKQYRKIRNLNDTFEDLLYHN